MTDQAPALAAIDSGNLWHWVDRLTRDRRVRLRRIEDGYCLNHHTPTCTTSPEARRT